MSTQIPTILKASPYVLNGATSAQRWDDNVTIAAFSANGSDAQISYRKEGGFGIVGGFYGNQIDYDPSKGASEQFEIDFNGDVQQVNLTLGRLEQPTAQSVGVWKAFSVEGNLVASGQLDPSVATSLNSDSYQFAIATNTPFDRLTIAAAADGTSSDFSLENVGYVRANEVMSKVLSIQADAPVTLAAKDAVSKDKGSRLVWDDGVEVTGYSADGNAAALKKSSSGLAVRGGRYGNQIDFDADLGKGEGLNLDFGGSIRQLSVVLGRMELDDGEGLPETGLWRAYGTDGSEVAAGQLDPSSAESLGGGNYRFAIDAGVDIARISIEATAYGDGTGTQYKDNNSDFSLLNVTYSRVGKGGTPIDSGGDSANGSDSAIDGSETGGEPVIVDNKPSAISDNITIDEDTSAVISITDLLSNDNLGDAPLSSSEIDTRSAQGGSITSQPDGTYLYTPTANFFGSDSFNYKIADSNGDTSRGTVNVTVNSVNDFPEAIGGFAETKVGVSIDIPVENDFGGDGPSRSAIKAGTAEHGTVSVNTRGTPTDPTDDLITYAPEAGFSGVDRLRYTISDADGDTSTATVTVVVDEPEVVNKKPQAANDRVTTDEDVSIVITAEKLLSNDSLGDVPTAVTTVASSSAKGGTVTSGNNGDYTYRPKSGFSGSDSFSYTIADTDGDTSTAKVNVQVNPIAPPVPPVLPMEPRNRVNLTASPTYLDGTTLPQRWGSEVRISASGFDGRAAKISYYEQKSDKGFGVISPRDRGKQLDFFQDKGSEKINLAFDTLVSNAVLTVGMMGTNEDNTGFDETGKWTALDANGRVVDTGLIGPDQSLLGDGVRAPGTYGQYPIEIDARSPFAELVIEATGFGHGKGGPTQQSYGENNSDFDITAISFDVVPGTQGGF